MYDPSEVGEYQKDQLLKTPDYNTAGIIHLAISLYILNNDLGSNALISKDLKQ